MNEPTTSNYGLNKHEGARPDRKLVGGAAHAKLFAAGTNGYVDMNPYNAGLNKWIEKGKSQ